MEAFSLLKYWRNSAGAGSGGGPDGSVSFLNNGAARTSSNSTTTIVTAVSSLASESDNDDDGPFFDLEFAVPDEEEEAVQHSKTGETDEDEDVDSDESDGEDENALKFTLSSGSSGDCTDPNVSESPSGELFFKGRLVPIEHSSTDLNGLESNSKLHFPVSLVKSARVMMLKMKKSKSNVSENAESKTLKKNKIEKLGPEMEAKEQNKLFTVKFKANALPIVSSLFVRDNSSKNLTNSKPEKENGEELAAAAAISDEKKFSKETVQRYLSGTVRNFQKVKPLYIRVSKRYGEKLRFTGQLSMSGGAVKDGGAAPPCTAENKKTPAEMSETETTAEAKDGAAGSNGKSCQRQCSLPTGLRIVYKHLGKSRSASSAAVAAAPPRAVSSKRRDVAAATGWDSKCHFTLQKIIQSF